MKLNDAVWGALVLLLGIAILVAIRNFPTIPGQQYGPALFPGVIAVGLIVCGGVLVYRHLALSSPQTRARWVTWDDWVHSPRHVVAFAVVVAVNVLYIALVDRLGFVLTAVAYLSALFAVFRVRARWVVPLAVVVTLIIHYAFYKLLRVPLPWGVLQGVAW
ncbi:MAG TPA: tripartite tricarboxylate transporter TctB family protein [Casimicrobiaceae bacterium]|nr:tripartite tricarboxylate transporter TctB family protein [Casimicrobiaceae bacterium]